MSEKQVLRGVLAGIAGGLVASWVMNEFSTTAGKKLAAAIETPEEQQQIASQSDGEDATMKAADAIASTVSGGQHLTHEQRAKGGPVVHYAFGALMGGLYGGLAEYTPVVSSGLGTTFGSVLFASADLFAVPALHLAPSPADQPKYALASPYAAHLVYGVTTDLVRRLVRNVL